MSGHGPSGARRRGLPRILGGALLVAVLAFAACTPGSRDDDETDQNVQMGRARKNAADYAGAVEAFERALQNNPRSATAHFELGLICYEHLSDWAGAIYHLQRYERLRPNSNKADVIKQLVVVCKQELAKEVPLGSISQRMQKEITGLVETNKALQQELEQLRLQLAQRALLLGPGASNTPPPALAQPAAPAPPAGPTPSAPPGPGVAGVPAASAPPASAASRSAAPRTHTVRQGETLYSIARKYGVTVHALTSANPGLDPRRLRNGQTVTVPAR